MPLPVQLPDQGSADTLQNAKVQSAQSLDAQARQGLAAAGFPQSAYTVAQPASGPSVQAVGIGTGPSADAQPPQGGPTADANEPDWGDAAPPPPAPAEPKQSLWSKTWDAVGRGAMDTAKGLGGAMNDAMAGVGQLAGALPVLHDALDNEFSKAGTPVSTEHQDAWFKMFVDPEVAHAQDFALDDSANFVDKALHAAGNMLGVVALAVATSPAEAAETLNTIKTGAEVATKAITHGTRAMAVPAVTSAVDKGRDVLAQTGDLATSIRASLVDYLTSTIGGIIPFSAPGKLLSRATTGAISGATSGEFSREAGNTAVAGTPGAQQTPFSVEDLVQNLVSGTVMGAVGGARPTGFGQEHAGTSDGSLTPPPGPAPPPANTPDMDLTGTPPPPPDAAAAPPSAGVVPPANTPANGAGTMPFGHESNPVTQPVAPTKVGDTPTAEPAADLRAQIADMKDPKTPRSGVFLSTDNLQQLQDPQVQGELDKATKAGRVVSMDNGTLITKTTALALNYKNMLAGGADPQVVLGDATGAGTGKTSDQTMVVQGRTPDGAVATEGVATPAEVPGKVAEAQAQGKQPVVGTVDQALQRREQLVNQPGPSAEAEPEPVKSPDEANTPPVTPDKSPQQATERGIVKTGGGDRAGVRAGETVDGKVPVKVIDEDGNPSDQVVHVPEDSWAPAVKPIAPEAETPVESKSQSSQESSSSVTPTSRAVDTSVDSASSRTTPVSETPREEKPVVEQKRAASSAPLEQLKDAADTLRSQDVPGNGKKWAGKIPERAGRIAEFARTLKAVAATLTGEDASHAYRTAQAAERLDLKSPEAMAKNQGIGHGELNAHRDNLLNAAQKLIDPNFVRPEAKRPGDAGVKLAARLARAKEALVEKPKPAATEKPSEPKTKVIEDVPDERVPGAKLTEGDRLKTRGAAKVYELASEKDAPGQLARLEKILDEHVAAGKLSPDDKDMAMYHAQGVRRDALEKKRGKSRDQEIEDEFADQRHDDGTELEGPRYFGSSHLGDRLWGEHEQRLDDAGFGDFISKQREHGLHNFLDFIHGAMKPGAGRSIISALRKFTPDIPVRFVDHLTAVNAEGASVESPAAGLYTKSTSRGQHDIQVSLNSSMHPLRILAHEAVHAATYQFMHANPNHALTQRIQHLFKVALARTARMAAEGEDVSGGNHWRTNEYEFVAEALSNHNLMDTLVRSEKYATPMDRVLSIVHALGSSIKQMLGFDKGQSSQLLDSILDASGRVMQAQHDVERAKQAYLSGMNEHMPGLDDQLRLPDDIAQLRSLDEPRMIPNEDKIRGLAGGKAADTARQFWRTTRAGTLRTLRKLIMSNEFHDQLFRSNTHWFGDSRDATNPVHALQGVENEKTAVSNTFTERAGPIMRMRASLGSVEDKALGNLQRDTTIYGVDPTKPIAGQEGEGTKGFAALHDQAVRNYNALSPDGQQVYRDERDFYKWAENQNRKTAINTALDTYSDKDVTEAQRRLLYSTRAPEDFDALIGPGGAIDVGDRNQALIDSLKNTAGTRVSSGPFFHLGRHGDLVVEVKPEGNKAFASRDDAERFSNLIKSLSPTSRAKVEEIGDSFNVNYKARYVSMHTNPAEAEAHAESLRAQGLEIGPVTEKVLSEDASALVPAAEKLVADASRKLSRRSDPGKSPAPEVKALISGLRESIMSTLASRSAYAASKLARAGVGGVKGEEMGRNFASYVQSAAWNNSHLATVFKSAEQLGKIRDMSKNPEAGVSQQTAYRRGAFMTELSHRMTQDVAQRGNREYAGINRGIARMGFLNYLFSPAHAGIWMTQNFTTGIPVAGARWGYGKTVAAFTKSMSTVAGPAFRQTFFEHVKPIAGKVFDSNHILDSVVKAVAKDKNMGKWAQHLDTMIKQGLVNTSFANELSNMSHGGWRPAERAFDYARLLPHMADVFNRVSSGLAALEMTNGDLQKSLDFVKETHMDYGQGNKSRVFKAINQFPGFNTVTMFRTYTQGMAHLLYSNVKNMVTAESKSRGEAARTVAGMVLATSLFTGVIKGATLEPLRLAVWAYNHIFGDSDEYHDLDNSIRKFVAGVTGNKAATQAITGGLPRLLGFDLSSRMGLADLFLHDPPDLLTADKDKWNEFTASLLGPMPQAIADNYKGIRDNLQNGNPFGALMSAVPVKVFHDSQKAWQLYSTGRQSAQGGTLTDPSARDAVIQGLGFKPASVADEEERSDSAYGYRQFENTRKAQLVQQYMANPENRGSVMDQVRAFNAAHPGDAISASDFIRASRSGQRAAALARGQPVRDPGMQDMTNY